MAYPLTEQKKEGGAERLIRTTFTDRENWLEGRAAGIGASDAAAVVGMSPWKSTLALWREKTGHSTPKDLSNSAAVEQGNRLEPALRGLFASMHPEFTVEYHQFDTLAQAERPWLFATLDGELTSPDGRPGILEIKTSTPANAAHWKDWDGQVPRHYYLQILWQFLATGWDFACLFACLFNRDGDATVRTYVFDRADCKSDLEWLLPKAENFWRHVTDGTMPPQALIL